MKLLVIDDHPIFLNGMQQMLSGLYPGGEVLLAQSGKESVDVLLGTPDVDCVFMDLGIPDISGLELLTRFRDLRVAAPVLVVSATEDASQMNAALQAGARGFIPKSASGEEYLRALRAVENGEEYLPENVRAQLAAHRAGRPKVELSQRQRDTLTLLAQGYTNGEIGVRLSISESTVKSHVSALFAVLGTSNRTRCVEVARSMGLI